jgi:pimeloyl-ACP methyl ester carboxylesterase
LSGSTEVGSRRRLAALAAGAVIITGACGSAPPVPSQSRAAAASAVGSPPSSAVEFPPTFTDTPCPDEITNDVVVSVSCGRLRVLEDRSGPSNRTVDIFVVRIEPPGGTTTADPVLVLGHLASQDGYGAMASAGQRTHRVEYLVDPRGIGHSIPSLDCPEVAAAGADLVGLRQRDPARRGTLLAAVRACHDRLTGQGIDPAAYDLAANAQDIEDLRTTLGIDTWNLISNGSASRLAFEVARRFPGGVRSLFIDSPSLPDPDFLTVAPGAFDQSIARLVAACSAQPACTRAAPDLNAMIREAETRLDAKPIEFDVTGTVAAVQLGHPIHVVVDGAALVRWLRAQVGGWGGSQSRLALTALTSILDGTLHPDGPLVSALAAGLTDCIGLLTSCERPNFGALYSIVCSDVAPHINQNRLDLAIAGRPAYQDAFAPSPLLAPCAVWPADAPETPPAGPLTGGVPTLVIRGAFDPFSAPIDEVDRAIAGIPEATSLEIPNQSYNALGFLECPVAIRNAWIDAPTQPPADISCLSGIPAIQLTP